MKQFLVKHSLVWGAVCLVVLLVTAWNQPRWYVFVCGIFGGAYVWQAVAIRWLGREMREELAAEVERSRRERLLPGAEDQIALFQVREREGAFFVVGDIKEGLATEKRFKLALFLTRLSHEVRQAAFASENPTDEHTPGGNLFGMN